MKIPSACLITCLAFTGLLWAQRPDFEVATVKVLPPVALGTNLAINLGGYVNDTMTMNNVTLSEALQFAYNLVSQEQVAGPDWIKSRETRYEIVAKAAPNTPLERVRLMTRSLIAARFKVVSHVEPRPVSFVALVPAKGGPKLVPADMTVQSPPAPSYVPGRMVATQMPMQVLVLLLSRFERQLVIDRTGLTGRYQVILKYTPEDRVAAAGDNAPPNLYTALEEQLGLRLERRREPIDVIVVEQAERTPTDN